MTTRTPVVQWIVPAIKASVMTLAAAATAFYYLRSLNRWFEEHSQREFRLKQLQLDIERASWLVETALEWDREKKEPIPDALLSSLSRDIFAYDGERSEPLRNPADELASALLGSASAIKVRLGDSEVSLDRRSIKDLNSDKLPARGS